MSRAPRSFLQALLPTFTLTKQEDGRLLDVLITADMSCIDSSVRQEGALSGRCQRRHCRHTPLGGPTRRFENDEGLLSRRFDCSGHPLRFGNGGVLPIIRLDDSDYFCLFYRDIFPIGWNIANGASDTLPITGG